MNGLTGKFSALLAGCVILAVATTTLVITRFYTTDQETTLIQSQTEEALVIERSLSEKFAVLHAQVKVTLESEENPIPKLLETLPEISGAAIWESGKQKTVLGKKLLPQTPPPPGKSEWAIYAPSLPDSQPAETISWVGRYQTTDVVLYLNRAWFEDSLANFRGLSADLLTSDAKLIVSNTSAEPLPASFFDWVSKMSLGVPSSQKITTSLGREILSTTLATTFDPPVIIHLHTPTQSINRVIYRTYRHSAVIAIVMLVITITVGVLFSLSLTRPLRALEAQTRDIAQGKFDLPTLQNASRGDEVGGLSRAFARMGQDLKKLREELRHTERLAALGKFSASIAHEIKNPLGAILINTQLAEEQLNSPQIQPQEIKQTLDYVKEETWRADRIVKSLMKFARNDKPEMREFNLNDRVRRSLAILQASLQQNAINLLWEVQEGPLYILGNEDNIHEVILNLVQNAIYAMKKSPTKNLKVKLSETSESILLQIEDSGSGIPEAVKANLFEPFFTTKPIGEGTGLGLSVCHGIMRNHGGKIDVTSEEGTGTCFTLTFPPRIERSAAA